MQLVLLVVWIIYGVGGKMIVIFLFLGGYEVDVVSGVELLGNYCVELIFLDQVVFIDKDGNCVFVGFFSVVLI